MKASRRGLPLLPEFLTSLVDYRLILYGLLLLVSMYWLPTGVIGALAGKRATWFAAPREANPLSAPPASVRNQAATVPLLDVAGVGIAFGGVAALSDVTVQVPSRGIHAIIGPNGAGKTTLLNVLSGFYAPGNGGVRLDQQRVHGRPPYAVARLGRSTFQTARLRRPQCGRECGSPSEPGNVVMAMLRPRVRRRARVGRARASGRGEPA
jgi:hypothetical protein